jgi:hypothetical protein
VGFLLLNLFSVLCFVVRCLLVFLIENSEWYDMFLENMEYF